MHVQSAWLQKPSFVPLSRSSQVSPTSERPEAQDENNTGHGELTRNHAVDEIATPLPFSSTPISVYSAPRTPAFMTVSLLDLDSADKPAYPCCERLFGGNAWLTRFVAVMPTVAFDPPARQFVPTAHHKSYDFIKPKNSHTGERCVLITGASKGIGQAIAIAYARAGYSHIALLARTSVAETVVKAENAASLEGHSPKFLELNADLSSVTSIDGAAAQLQATFGSLDILINNAGYLENWVSIVDSDPEEWWKTWEVNVRGTYLMNRAFIPLLLKGKEKTSITVTSVGAWVTKPGGSAYQGSKTAQVRMNNHLMMEYGEQGLLAYAIHPGNVKTNLALGMPDYMHETLQDEPEMAADTIVWLTRERRLWLADRYISSTWDMEELLAKEEEIVSGDLLKLNLSR